MHIPVGGTEVLVSRIAYMAMSSLVSAIENTQCVWHTHLAEQHFYVFIHLLRIPSSSMWN